MQFTSIIAACAILSLATAAPAPTSKCVKQTTCAVAKFDPAPASHVCGVVGTAHLTPGELIGDNTKQTEVQCASSCINDDECESFAFDRKDRRCLTFRKTPTEMGFKKDPSNAFQFWSAACWGTHCYPTEKCT